MSGSVQSNEISMVRGDSGRFTVRCAEPDGTERPFVEGDTVVFTLKRCYTGQEAVEKTLTVFTDGGEAVVNLAPGDTASLPVGTYWYDVRLKTAGCEIHTIVPKTEFQLREEIGHV